MSNDFRKKVVVKLVDVGSLLNILVGNIKVNSGKVYVVGNCKLSVCNYKYISGKVMIVVNSYEVINRWMLILILVVVDNVSYCLSVVVIVYLDCWVVLKKMMIMGGIVVIWGCFVS